MLDDDFEFGDDPYERIREQKPLKVRLRNFLYGCVAIGLVAVVAFAVATKYAEKTKSYGRIIAAGELYEAPVYENKYSTISYESLHPELKASTEVKEVVEQPKEDTEKQAQEEEKEADVKAKENIVSLSKTSAREKAKQRSEKYKISEITTEETVTIGPTTGTQAGMNDTLGYYVGGPSAPVYVDPVASGAEYLGRWKITAYCACVICCLKADGVTASGAMVQANHTIAAPKEFKFGTKLIVGGQLYVVEDRGGSIHGHRIDIYFNTHQEANDFGVRYMDVYQLP